MVADGATGALVPPGDSDALCAALERYASHPALVHEHGLAARLRVTQHYAMPAMVAAYQALYDELCERKLKLRRRVASCAE